MRGVEWRETAGGLFPHLQSGHAERCRVLHPSLRGVGDDDDLAVGGGLPQRREHDLGILGESIGQLKRYGRDTHLPQQREHDLLDGGQLLPHLGR